MDHELKYKTQNYETSRKKKTRRNLEGSRETVLKFDTKHNP